MLYVASDMNTSRFMREVEHLCRFLRGVPRIKALCVRWDEWKGCSVDLSFTKEALNCFCKLRNVDKVEFKGDLDEATVAELESSFQHQRSRRKQPILISLPIGDAELAKVGSSRYAVLVSSR